MYRWIYGCLLLLSLVPLMLAGYQQRKDSVDDPEDAEELKDRALDLQEEFMAARGKALTLFQEAKTAGEKDKVYQGWYLQQEKLSARLLAMAEKNHKNPAAVDILIWIVQNVTEATAGKNSTRSRAVDLLIRDHNRNDKIIESIAPLSQALDKGSERLLRSLMTKNHSLMTQGRACMALAESRRDLAQWVQSLRPAPQDLNQLREQELRGDNVAMIFLSKETIDLLSKLNVEQLAKESETLFQRVMDDYGNITIKTEESNTVTLGELAQKKLFASRLSINKKAADIESADIKGKKVRLSDYKGKVVVLNIWASWCPPCRAMIPQQRGLVQRLAEEPFVLISVSVDEDVETLKAFLRRESMPWTHWYNGPSGGILDRLGIKSVPVIYVFDAQGVLRYEDVRGEKVHQAIAALIKETKAGIKKSSSPQSHRGHREE